MNNKANRENIERNGHDSRLSTYFHMGRQEHILMGFNSLDENFGGLRNGEVIVVSGYSNMGKTTFITNLIKNISVEQGIPTLFFSLQTTEYMVAQNLLSSMSGLNLNYQLSCEELSFLKIQEERLCKAPIYVNSENLKVDLLGCTIEDYVRRNGIKAVFIDGLRNIFTSHRSTSAIEEIFQILKATAMQLNVPIVVTDTCKVGESDSSFPLLHYPQFDYTSYDPVYDACDVMLVLHRPDTFGIVADDCGRNYRDILTVGVEKNSQGVKGRVQLKYDFSTKAIYEEPESDFGIVLRTEMLED